MPGKEIRSELPSRPDWEKLLATKRKWEVSISALLLRAKTLGIMAETTYVQAMNAMSARDWRRSEPGYLGLPERPVMLGMAVELSTVTALSLRILLERASTCGSSSTTKPHSITIGTCSSANCVSSPSRSPGNDRKARLYRLTAIHPAARRLLAGWDYHYDAWNLRRSSRRSATPCWCVSSRRR